MARTRKRLPPPLPPLRTKTKPEASSYDTRREMSRLADALYAEANDVDDHDIKRHYYRGLQNLAKIGADLDKGNVKDDASALQRVLSLRERMTPTATALPSPRDVTPPKTIAEQPPFEVQSVFAKRRSPEAPARQTVLQRVARSASQEGNNGKA